MRWPLRALLLFAMAIATCSCGSKTGLLVPEAGIDAGRDSGVDAGRCLPQPVILERRGAQIMFAIDGSNSMLNTIDDREPLPGELSRWQELGFALGEALMGADPLLEVGAKFFPNQVPGTMGPEEACVVDRGIDVEPARDNVDRLLQSFASTEPLGGTPTAPALEEVRAYYERRPAPGIPRFVVLATDGGPNCNPDTGVPMDRCVCTGSPTSCLDAMFGRYNCLDEARTLDVIRATFDGLGVPVYVIGIDDPTRPDLGDVLDRMADAGGRPREVPGQRRFYSVREVDDLRGALESITSTIARCVFTLQPVPGTDAELLVTVDGVRIARDATRAEGWDYTAPDRSELTLFGGACSRVTEGGGTVTAELMCIE
ncbi:MAG: hypothetical protein AB7S26_07125 [Sandaracinaceae bacterium]